MPKRKLTTDSIVKNLFDPLKEILLEGRASFKSSDEETNIFFQEIKTDSVAVVPPEDVPIQTRPAVKEKIFFWSFLFAFLLISTHFFLSYLEEENRLRQSQSLFELKQNEFSFWKTELEKRKEGAKILENQIRKIQAEEKDLAKNLDFLQSHLGSGKGYSTLLSELYRIQPKSVIFQELSFRDSQIFLKGFASDGSFLLEFFRRLRTSFGGIKVSVQSPSELADYFYSFEVGGYVVP